MSCPAPTPDPAKGDPDAPAGLAPEPRRIIIVGQRAGLATLHALMAQGLLVVDTEDASSAKTSEEYAASLQAMVQQMQPQTTGRAARASTAGAARGPVPPPPAFAVDFKPRTTAQWKRERNGRR